MTVSRRQGSGSIEQPDYWWYRARTGLLQAVLAPHLGRPRRVLDVGSADGPSVAWLRGDHERVAVDLDPRGLRAGEGVCASALALPFADASFDVVGAFDVIEHCDPEHQAVAELYRVLRPGGRLLLAVPAYQWAWSEHDVRAGHYRRYTRRRLLRALSGTDLAVDRVTYAFTSVFPFFAMDRLRRRLHRRPEAETGLPQVSPAVDRLFMTLTGGEQRVLRRWDLPFGSSIFLAARKPEVTGA